MSHDYDAGSESKTPPLHPRTQLTWAFAGPVYSLAFSAQASTSSGSHKASVASPNYSTRPSPPSKLAVGSFIEGYAENYVALVAPSGPSYQRGQSDGDQDWGYADDGGDYQMRRSPSVAGTGGRWASGMVEIARAPHQYPCTAIEFAPPSLAASLQTQGSASGVERDMLATTSDCLRLWDVAGDAQQGWRVTQRSALVTSKSEFAAPLTSFAWSSVDPSLVVSSSVDTTCTIWDIKAGSAITQLIAHDREVYDVSWSPSSRDIFASVGADGSVRMFDIRALEHSTILYEVSGTPSGSTALLRLAFNPSDENQLAIVHADSPHVFLLDVRKPSVPIAELRGHRSTVNGFAWDQQNALATCSDDCQVLVWDLSDAAMAGQAARSPTTTTTSSNGRRGSTTSNTRVMDVPSLAYGSSNEVNSVAFGPGEWVAMTTGTSVRCLKV